MGGLFGGGGGSSGGTVNNVSGAAQYVPRGQGAADQAYQQLFESLASLPNYAEQNLPAVTANVNALENNPYAAGAQTGANTAGTILSGLNGQDVAAANQLQPYESEVLNTAFDPQNALFNQESQKLQDQVNATNSMYGLGSSPVGASILDNQLQNFDINWQNNQLNRQATGTSLAGQLGQDVNALGNAGANAATGSGAVPNQAYTANIQNILQALTGLTAAGSAVTEQPTAIANLLQSYLGLGQTANRNNLAAQQQGFGDLMQGAAGAYTLGNSIFGGGSGAIAPAIASAAPGIFGSSAVANTADPLAGLYGVSGTVGSASDMAALDSGVSAADSGGLFSGIGDAIMSIFA